MIKNSFFKIVALGAVLIFASSCKKSSSVDPVDDTPSDRISNGLYVKKVGEAPSSNNILLSENVEGANTRVGFYASYLYLTAGSYQIANVIDQEVKQLYGGVSKDTTDARESKGGFDTYSLIPGYVLDGAPFVLTVDGFYKVVIDQASKEIVYVQIKRAELIGSATPGLWEGGSDGQQLTFTGLSSSAVSLKLNEIVLRPGEYKVRFNSRWKIVRPAYVTVLDFGGTVANPVIGGSNMTIPTGGDGKYSFEINWTPATGPTLKLTKLSSLPALTFGDINKWGIIGDATPLGWDNQTDFTYDGKTGSTHKFSLTVSLTGEKEFKIRTPGWAKELNRTDGNTKTGTALADFGAGGGSNWKVLGSTATYTIILTTTDEGATWTIDFALAAI